MKVVANTQGMVYPFFGGSGSMWVVTNQCVNRQLRQCKNKEVRPIETAAFSIAMNGTEARLYISWKNNDL
jgi:hypothetical protein